MKGMAEATITKNIGCSKLLLKTFLNVVMLIYFTFVDSKDVLSKWKYLTDQYKKVRKVENTEEPTGITGAEESKRIKTVWKHYKAIIIRS